MLPIILEGKYQTFYDLYGHKRPGLSLYERKLILSGSKINISKITYLKHSVWGKCGEGWVCMYMNRKFNMERIGS